MIRLFLTLPFLLAACLKDETISGYADPDATYRLVELNGTPFKASATITFAQQGSVTGKAPCNSFAARQTSPYPWFELTAMRVTRSACKDIEKEREYLTALQNMTLIEVSGDVLILRNTDGDEMVFQAIRP